MVSQSPTERIEWLSGQQLATETVADIHVLLDSYERFLNVTSASEAELIELFQNESHAHELRDEQSAFGDLAYKVLFSVGRESKFYRRLVV